MDLKAAVLQSTAESNILPLTSRCNLHCVFCSHRQNPPGVESVYLPERPVADVVESFDYIDPKRKVLIGESATRIMEGEPFTHPDLMEILRRFRGRFPKTTIQVTTNGSCLTPQVVSDLKALGGLELIVSLNSATPEGRLRLMGDRCPQAALDGIAGLSQAGIPFHGSVVACPHLVGWADLTQTAVFLSRAAARTIRVFLPGFTKLAPSELRFGPDLYVDLRKFVAGLGPMVTTPVLLEPALVSDLAAMVEGVIAGFPAGDAGLFSGDRIIHVDGRPVKSRVDAFEQIRKALSPRVTVLRQGRVLEIKVAKGKGNPSGLIMSFDLDLDRLGAVLREARRYRAANALIMCSPWAEGVFKQALTVFADSRVEFELLPVPSCFFGGSIGSAGLLVVDDFIRAFDIRNAGRPHAEKRTARIIAVPYQAFDRNGRDLLGQSVYKLEEHAGCPVPLC